MDAMARKMGAMSLSDIKETGTEQNQTAESSSSHSRWNLFGWDLPSEQSRKNQSGLKRQATKTSTTITSSQGIKYSKPQEDVNGIKMIRHDGECAGVSVGKLYAVASATGLMTFSATKTPKR